MGKGLWDKILETVKPLKSRESRFGYEVPMIKKNLKNTNDLMESVSFISAEDVVKSKKIRNILEPEILIGNASRIDKNLKRDVDKNFVADAKLDLHGKTLDDGYRLFVNFINKNYDVGHRRLIVVTGKGTPSRGTGVIKKNFPMWLRNTDVADKILYVNYANVRDGGDGAVYILLRKSI